MGGSVAASSAGAKGVASGETVAIALAPGGDTRLSTRCSSATSAARPGSGSPPISARTRLSCSRAWRTAPVRSPAAASDRTSPSAARPLSGSSSVSRLHHEQAAASSPRAAAASASRARASACLAASRPRCPAAHSSNSIESPR